MRTIKDWFLALLGENIINLILVTPILLLVSALITLFASISQIILILSTQWLFDSVEQNFGNVAVNYLFIFFAIKIFNALLSPAIKVIDAPIESKMFVSISAKLNRRISNLEPLYLESSNNLDAIEKARKATAALPQVIIFFKWIVFYYCPYFLIMAGYLWSLRPVLSLCILFILIPMIISQLFNYSAEKIYIDESTHYARVTKYYQSELTDTSHVKEAQVLGIGNFIYNKYIDSSRKFCEKTLEYEKKCVKFQILSLMLYLTGYAMSILLLYSSLCDGYITVGAFSAIFSSLGDLLLFTHMFVKVYIKRLMQNIAISKNIHILPQNSDGDVPMVDEISSPSFIEFNHVSFTYPGAKDEVLHDICFTINKNETIVIVGANGAGKTTIANMILGNYRPTKGIVTYSSKDLYTYPITLRTKFKSGVVQNFGKFKLTLYENISLCDREYLVHDTAIEEACEKTELPRTFLNTYKNTVLSKEYGGIDVSGGQWQNIAIARGAYKRSNLLVLDEPTSAIDPLAEGMIYDNYLALSKNKTTIIISHRLGCVSFADRVMFLKNGRIEGFDTHEKLLRSNKSYFDFYMSQAQWYISPGEEGHE